MTSLAVADPGSSGTGVPAAASRRAGVAPGLTAKAADSGDLVQLGGREHGAGADDRLRHLGPERRIDSSAAAVRSVISSTRTPPATSALASGTACGRILDHDHRDDRRLAQDGCKRDWSSDIVGLSFSKLRFDGAGQRPPTKG